MKLLKITSEFFSMVLKTKDEYFDKTLRKLHDVDPHITQIILS